MKFFSFLFFSLTLILLIGCTSEPTIENTPPPVPVLPPVDEPVDEVVDDAVCEGDPSRTDFVGGPQTSACRTHDDDLTICESAFARTSDGSIVSCFVADDSTCRGCAPKNEREGNCVNACAS